MLSSSEMDCFLAGLSEDWSELYAHKVLTNFVDTMLGVGWDLETVHTTLEDYFVAKRGSMGKLNVVPKPYSAVIKMKPTVVYNRWTQEELDKYVLSKTPSVQSKLDEQLIATLYSAVVSQAPSSPNW